MARDLGGWRRALELEEQHAADLHAMGWPQWAPTPAVWLNDPKGLVAFLGHEHAGGLPHLPKRWHLSMRGPQRTPTWEELVEAAHYLRPGVVFVCGVPPRSWWVNVHPDVLHLWETTDELLVEEYRVNARGDKPT